MTRIAVSAPHRDRCGVADYARQLAVALPERFEVSALAYPESDSSSAWQRTASAVANAQLVHLHYEYSLFGTVKPMRNRLATFLQTLRASKVATVVTLHQLLPQLKPRWQASSPYRLQDVVRDLAYLPFLSSWEQRQYGLADHYVVHNKEQRSYVAERVGEQHVTAVVLPITETTVQWSPEQRSHEQACLVTPGFVKAHKGLGAFLATLEHLDGVRWTVAGGPQDARDDRALDELHSGIAERQLTDRVNITGYLPRELLERAAAEADLAVFPFEQSHGSASVALAIGLGMPVMTTDIPVFDELVQAGAGIVTLPQASPDRWAQRIEDLLRSPSQLGELAAANRDFATRHSFRNAGELHGQLYDRLLCR